MTDEERKQAFDQIVARTPEWVEERWQTLISRGAAILDQQLAEAWEAFQQLPADEQRRWFAHLHRANVICTYDRAGGMVKNPELVVHEDLPQA